MTCSLEEEEYLAEVNTTVSISCSGEGVAWHSTADTPLVAPAPGSPLVLSPLHPYHTGRYACSQPSAGLTASLYLYVQGEKLRRGVDTCVQIGPSKACMPAGSITPCTQDTRGSAWRCPVGPQLLGFTSPTQR